MTVFITTYVFMQLVVASGLAYMIRQSSDELDRENFVMMIVATIFAPLSLMGFGGFILHDKVVQKHRRKALKILNDWEHLAAEQANVARWDWFKFTVYKDKRYEALRETVVALSDDDLEHLSRIGKNVHEIEKPVRDAVINELVDRKLFR